MDGFVALQWLVPAMFAFFGATLFVQGCGSYLSIGERLFTFGAAALAIGFGVAAFFVLGDVITTGAEISRHRS